MAINLELDSSIFNKSLNLGRAIKEARRLLKIRQKELCERCKISQSFLSQIENGDRNPTVETMELISNGLGLPVHLLIYMASENTKDKKSESEISILIDETFQFFKQIYFKELLEKTEKKKLENLEKNKILINQKIKEMKSLKSDFEKIIKEKTILTKEELKQFKGKGVVETIKGRAVLL